MNNQEFHKINITDTVFCLDLDWEGIRIVKTRVLAKNTDKLLVANERLGWIPFQEAFPTYQQAESEIPSREQELIRKLNRQPKEDYEVAKTDQSIQFNLTD